MESHVRTYVYTKNKSSRQTRTNKGKVRRPVHEGKKKQKKSIKEGGEEGGKEGGWMGMGGREGGRVSDGETRFGGRHIPFHWFSESNADIPQM